MAREMEVGQIGTRPPFDGMASEGFTSRALGLQTVNRLLFLLWAVFPPWD
jgi:hypothetical protein